MLNIQYLWLSYEYVTMDVYSPFQMFIRTTLLEQAQGRFT